MHRALVRAIFAFMTFTRILHRPERTFPSPFLFGIFSALWTADFIALVDGRKQFEIISAFCTAILIEWHKMFPPAKINDIITYNAAKRKGSSDPRDVNTMLYPCGKNIQLFDRTLICLKRLIFRDFSAY